VSNCTAVSKVTAPVNATSIRAELRREYHPSRKMFWRVKFIVWKLETKDRDPR
jgi:hypothetical protein